MVEAHTGVSSPSIPLVVPEGVHRFVWVGFADGVDTTAFEETAKGSASFRMEERIIAPRLCRIDIELGWHDVVVASENRRVILFDQQPRALDEPLKPGELVVEFGSRLRIAIGRIEAADRNPTNGRFDISALTISRIAGNASAVCTGAAPLARMATPFHVLWPCQIAP